MDLPKHDRYDYSALPTRPDYSWPGGKRLAVCIGNNIEHFAFLSGLGSDGTQAGAPQSTRNYAWRDYGNRVGQWYMFDLLDEMAVPAAHNVNSLMLDACPEIVERIKARGDEVVGHGRTNAERQDVLPEAEEARLIADSSEGIARHFGKPPEGWLGPYLAQSPVTLDPLKEAGYSYVLDWPAAGRRELYDLNGDSLESKNLAKIRGSHSHQLALFLRRHYPLWPKTPPALDRSRVR